MQPFVADGTAAVGALVIFVHDAAKPPAAVPAQWANSLPINVDPDSTMARANVDPAATVVRVQASVLDQGAAPCAPDSIVRLFVGLVL